MPDTLSNYDRDGEETCRFTVTDITYEFKPYDGGLRLYLYFSGEKLYDAKGEGQSAECDIGWKLYDMDNTVIDDGVGSTLSLKMGEKFKKAEDYNYDTVLEPGAYSLEIMSVN